MPSKSKTKGNSHERNVAKILTQWWGEEFKRTPGSGFLRWQNSVWTYGDLLPPESFIGVIECKFYKENNLNILLTGTPQENNILGWWEQAVGDSERCYLETQIKAPPLLITKANYQPILLCVSENFALALKLGKLVKHLTFKHDKTAFVICHLDDFLQCVDKDAYLQAIQRLN